MLDFARPIAVRSRGFDLAHEVAFIDHDFPRTHRIIFSRYAAPAGQMAKESAPGEAENK